MKELGHENIIAFIKVLGIRWLGHIERTNEERVPKMILNAKLIVEEEEAEQGSMYVYLGLRVCQHLRSLVPVMK